MRTGPNEMERRGGTRAIDLPPRAERTGVSRGPGPRWRDTSQGLPGVINHGWLQPGTPGLGKAVMGG